MDDEDDDSDIEDDDDDIVEDVTPESVGPAAVELELL
jgi:hypothetical protein